MSSHENRSVSGFEVFQFGATRFIALLIAAVAWLAIIGIVLFLLFRDVGSSTYVSAADVGAVAEAGSTSNSPDSNAPTPAASYSIPDNLKEYFSGDNKPVLEGWLEGLDRSQQQDFLDNLSDLVASAHQSDPTALVNAYKTIKLQRLGASPFDRYMKTAQTAGAIASLIAALFMIILTSLVLVLLAIERNTRRPQDGAPTQSGYQRVA